MTKNRYKNKCPICGDYSSCCDRLRIHFVDCVGRNGNPHGFCWNAEKPSRLARLSAVNGVVVPSLLKPGQPPIQTNKRTHKHHGGNQYCLICDDVFNRPDRLKVHFVTCVERNGNPHGYRWDDLLERRIGKETNGLHFQKDGERDQGTKASTSDMVSGDDLHIIRYEPSGSCNTTQSLGARSVAKKPRLRHKRSDYTDGPPVARTETDHAFGSAVVDLSDEEAAHMDTGTAQAHVCGSSQMVCRSANVCFRVHRQGSLKNYKRVHTVCLMKASSPPWPSPQVRRIDVTRLKPLWRTIMIVSTVTLMPSTQLQRPRSQA